MSVPPAAAGGAPQQHALLFTPGARLGWIFRDRRELADPYPQSPPDEKAMREQAEARLKEADDAYLKMRKYVGIPGVVAMLLLVVLFGTSGRTLPIALILGAAGIATTSVYWQRRERA